MRDLYFRTIRDIFSMCEYFLNIDKFIMFLGKLYLQLMHTHMYSSLPSIFRSLFHRQEKKIVRKVGGKTRRKK